MKQSYSRWVPHYEYVLKQNELASFSELRCLLYTHSLSLRKGAVLSKLMKDFMTLAVARIYCTMFQVKLERKTALTNTAKIFIFLQIYVQDKEFLLNWRYRVSIATVHTKRCCTGRKHVCHSYTCTYISGCVSAADQYLLWLTTWRHSAG